MGNSACYHGQRGLSERDDNPPDGTATAGTSERPGQAAGPAATFSIGSAGACIDDTLSGEPIGELLFINQDPVEGRRAPGATQAPRDFMVTTINMIPVPAVSQNSIVLQTPEEMMEDIQILKPVGAGAFAVVYRGVYQGGDVAIKLASVDADKMGWTEAFVASQLRHPHVVHTFSGRAAKVTQEFHDRVWNGPRPVPLNASEREGGQPAEETSRRLASPDMLPAASSEDSMGAPRKATHERQGWRDVLSRVGATPNKGLLMLVQEYCDKGNLSRVIQSGLFKSKGKGPRGKVLARRMLLRTATEICRGMIHLHRASVIHGDLKPANVLLATSNADRRGFIAKIADFGLARTLQHDASRVESETSGTAPYMSPETFNGVHSRASDVYAFGIMLWEMLCCARPYAGVPIGQIMLGVSFQGLRPKWPDEEWPELCAVGRSCLAQDPAERPSFRDLEERLVALEEAVRDESRRQSEESQRLMESPSASRPGSHTPPPRPIDPTDPFSAAAAALADAAAAAGAAAARDPGRDGGDGERGGGVPAAAWMQRGSPPALGASSGIGMSAGGPMTAAGSPGDSFLPPPVKRPSHELRRAAAAVAAAAAPPPPPEAATAGDELRSPWATAMSIRLRVEEPAADVETPAAAEGGGDPSAGDGGGSAGGGPSAQPGTQPL